MVCCCTMRRAQSPEQVYLAIEQRQISQGFPLQFFLCIFRLAMLNSVKIAIVHDWLVTMRGGEKVLEVLCELFPDATLYTLVHKNGSVSSTIERMKIRKSLLQYIPFGVEHYQYFLPLFPIIIKQFDLSNFDLVISSSHAVAKAVKTRKEALHICYCHTPMRYIWDQYDDYFGRNCTSPAVRIVMRILRNPLQKWDVRSSKGVDYFIANSENVRSRILRLYKREAMVIYPPVEVQRFSVSQCEKEYYLIVSALVPYKRIDLAVEVFNKIGKRLLIVGTGAEEKRLRKIANKNIEFLGWVDDEQLPILYAESKALIFPGEEDFGIVPVEAMACGKPVIAYAKGGALETVVDGKTGILFYRQTQESLIEAINNLESCSFNPDEIRSHALQFDREKFKERIDETIRQLWKNHCAGKNL